MFTHLNKLGDFELEANTIDGVRYYTLPSGQKAPSITSITSFYNRQTFVKWRKKIGEEEANKITKVATDRGTKFHDLVEKYLLNEDINSLDILPTTKALFLKGKKSLDNINNIKEVSIGHALICDTFEYGLQETIKKYLTLTNN